jgi:hypothetical protein
MSKPKLLARFILDNAGAPQWDEDDNGYWIRLFVSDVPEDTYGVIYELHESYNDPIREGKKKPEFAEEITSFGDYSVVAKLRRKTRTDQLARLLSKALRDGHESDMTASVDQAIQDLKEN